MTIIRSDYDTSTRFSEEEAMFPYSYNKYTCALKAFDNNLICDDKW